MSKVIIYIAASLDGYIARKNDDISWLDAYQKVGEDYGYANFIKTIGTAIMGARTYAQSLKHPERMLKMKTYVLSHKQMPVQDGFDVTFYKGNLKKLVEKIKTENEKDIWIVGGGKVVSSFLNEGLVDEVLHFVVPVLIGNGIPLYSTSLKETKFMLLESKKYKSGIVKLHYALK